MMGIRGLGWCAGSRCSGGGSFVGSLFGDRFCVSLSKVYA